MVIQSVLYVANLSIEQPFYILITHFIASTEIYGCQVQNIILITNISV